MIAARGANRRAPPSTTAPTQARDPSAAIGEGELVCAACGFVVTHEAARITVDGAHAHARTNPHGFTYDFGCFSEAPGTVPSGAPSMQATWFAGHFWWIRNCGGCGTHLGWLFYRGDQREGAFYGLILDRLRAVYDSGR